MKGCKERLSRVKAPLLNNSSKSVVVFFFPFLLFIFVFIYFIFLQFWRFHLKKEPLRVYVSFKYYTIGNSTLLPSNIAGNKFFTFRSVKLNCKMWPFEQYLQLVLFGFNALY